MLFESLMLSLEDQHCISLSFDSTVIWGTTLYTVVISRNLGEAQQSCTTFSFPWKISQRSRKGFKKKTSTHWPSFLSGEYGVEYQEGLGFTERNQNRAVRQHKSPWLFLFLWAVVRLQWPAACGKAVPRLCSHRYQLPCVLGLGCSLGSYYSLVNIIN